MFNINDIVYVKGSTGESIKRGVIVGLTTHGALIHDPNVEAPYVDHLLFPEWFPFKSKELNMYRTGAIFDGKLKK